MKTKMRIAAMLLALLAALMLVPAGAEPMGSAALADGASQSIRVLLSTEGATALTVPVAGSYTLKEAARAFTGGTLTIRGDGSSVTVTHSKEGALYSGARATIERADMSRSGGTLSVKTVAGTRAYLGDFIFTASGSVLSAVNRVPLSHYLYGVIAYEMSNEFPLEALKAQAVAAKGYALLHIRGTGAYDIGDTASDQVYRGYVESYTNVIEAVDSTITDVLYYKGKVLQCYYAASNGGWAILPGARWSSKEYDGAFISGADAYDMRNPSSPVECVYISSAYAAREMGTKAFSFIDARLMAAAGAPGVIPENYRFAGVKSINAVTAGEAGGYAGDKNYGAYKVDATLVAELLDAAIPTPTPTFAPTPSPTPTLEPTIEPTTSIEPTLSPTPLGEGEAADPTTPEPTDTPEPTGSPEPVITPEQVPTPSPTPTFAPTPSPTPDPEFTREIPVSFSFTVQELADAGLFKNTSLRISYAQTVAGGFEILHARYGHGVGMSQRGAQQMAAEGKRYQEILAYYYPGATLGTMSYTFPESMTAAAPETAATAPGTGLVQGGRVNMRAKAGTSGKVVEKLEENTPLTLLGMQNDWYYVQAPSGNLGYVRYDLVLMTGNTMIARGETTASAVNYRQGPGTSYGTIGKLSSGTQLGVYGMIEGWYKVRAMTTGQVGFIKKGYIKITEPLADAAVQPSVTPVPGVTLAPGATPIPGGILPAPGTVHTGQATYAASGQINGSAVNIRAGASTSTQSYGKLARGTQLGIFEKSGAWYRVQVTASGQEGYVYGRYVSLTAPASDAAEQSSGYVNASGTHLRKGAGTGYDSLGRLSRNTTVTILASSGSWYQVRLDANDIEGYIFSKYVTMTGLRPPETQKGVITARLNLRIRPSTGTGSKVLLVMPKGAVVTVYSVVNGWAYVNYEGTSGYCISSCVKTG